ncbi:MAG: ABC transporter substrate-binding protein [Steroidobacteraceae bacterium]
MDQIVIGMVSPAFVFFPVWVAQDQGMFAERGIKADAAVYGATDKVTDALRTGVAQICMVTPEGVIADAAAGGTLRLIAGNANRAPLSLITPERITSIADLKGKRVGTTSLKEGTAVMVQKILAAHGLHYPGDYEFALVGAHPQRWEHLQNGTIDAGLQLLPYNFMAEDAGYNNLAEASDHVPDYAFTAVGVNGVWGEAHRDLVVRTLAAMRKAITWADANRAQASDIIAQHTKSKPQHALRGLNEMLDKGVTPRDMAIAPRALEAVFSAMLETRLVPPGTALSYAAVVDDTYLRATA